MITLAPTSLAALNMALAVPGTPAIPVPSTLTRANLSIVANDLTQASKSAFSLAGCLQIVVPGADRLNIFLMTIGILSFITGIMVRGCKTFAPKYDISQAS